jgi:hypothetical protein
MQIHRYDAVIIFGARLRQHLLEVRGLLISSGSFDGDGWWLIVEHRNVVLIRAPIAFAINADEFDVVGRVGGNRRLADEICAPRDAQ